MARSGVTAGDVLVYVAGGILILFAWQSGALNSIFSGLSSAASSPYNRGYMDGVIQQQANDADFLVFPDAPSEEEGS